MTLDEPANWGHAAALARGEMPRPATQVFTSEHETVQKIARWLGDSDAGSILSDKALSRLAGWLVVRRGVLTVWFDEIAPEERVQQLRQQQVSHYSDEDQILERLHELKVEEDLLYGYLASMGSPYARKLRDPDEVGADEDDLRIARERADERAVENAPGLAS